MTWPHYTTATPRIIAILEEKREADALDAISFAFQNGLRFDESDFPAVHLAKHEALLESGAAADALNYRKKHGIQIDHERRVRTKIRSLAVAYSGPTPQEVHAQEVAAKKAAEREAYLDKRARELVELEEAAARVRRVQKAREQLAKDGAA
jgi:hypothetical protein